MWLTDMLGVTKTPQELKRVKELKGKMMTAVIVQLMAEYVSQQQTLISIKENKSAVTEYDRLVRLGLGSTKNAKLLKEKIDAVRLTNENYEKAQQLMEFVKQLRTEFGPNTFLISTEQFNAIVEKYDLQLRSINKYTGVIPEENIREVEIAVEAASKTSLPLNRWKDKNQKDFYAFYVDYVQDRRWREYDSRYYLNPIDSHGSVVEIKKYRDEPDADDAHEANKWFPKCENGILIKLKGKRLSKTDMLIAAPNKCFKENFRVERVPVDPIVYQVCPFGIVIHSVWGEEADDKVLAKYKEFNENLFK